MRIPLDREGVVPLFRQIAALPLEGITSEKIASGSRLPSSRRSAGDLGVSRITVATAHADLESDVVVECRPGQAA